MSEGKSTLSVSWKSLTRKKTGNVLGKKWPESSSSPIMLCFSQFLHLLFTLLENSNHGSGSADQCGWDGMPWSSLGCSVAPTAATLSF